MKYKKLPPYHISVEEALNFYKETDYEQLRKGDCIRLALYLKLKSDDNKILHKNKLYKMKKHEIWDCIGKQYGISDVNVNNLEN